MNTATANSHAVSPTRLWFGFAGSAGAWIALGIIDILITWQACVGKEQYGAGQIEPGFRLLYVLLTLALFATAITAGIISYRNWRELSRERSLREAEGRGREEYMALAGVFISLTLGVGIIWLAIPLAIIDMCVRAR